MAQVNLNILPVCRSGSNRTCFAIANVTMIVNGASGGTNFIKTAPVGDASRGSDSLDSTAHLTTGAASGPTQKHSPTRVLETTSSKVAADAKIPFIS